MMTTEPQVTASAVAPVLRGAASLAALVGLVVTAIGALAVGSAAAYGALVGTVLVVAVFSFGAFTLDLVAGAMPAMSLVFALLTYVLQLGLLALVLTVLSTSGLLETALDADWLVGAVIAGTLAWSAAQVVLTTRMRIPVYDLDLTRTHAGER